MQEIAKETSGEVPGETPYWLEKAPVFKAIRHMALPMILGMAIGSIYNFTDTLFLGWLGDTASLAAVSLCMPYQAVAMALADLVGVGASTAISRRFGGHDVKGARSISAFAFWAALVLSVVAAVATLVFIRQILAVLGASGEALCAAEAYLRVTGIALPAGMLNLVLCQLVRSKADSKSALHGMLGSSLVNIALDPVCIYGLGMGVAGAALATAIANVFAVAFYLVCISRSGELSFHLCDVRIDAAQLADIFKIGSAAATMSLLMAVSSLTFNMCAMRYGQDVVAGFGISQSVVQLIELVAMGLYEGVVPLIAAAYGACNRDRLHEVVRKTALCLAVYMALAGGIAWVLREPIVGCFSANASVIAVAATIFASQLGACAFAAASGLITGIFQAKGRGVAANVAAVARGVMLVPCVLVGGALFGLSGIVWSLLVAEALAFVVCLGACALVRA